MTIEADQAENSGNAIHIVVFREPEPVLKKVLGNDVKVVDFEASNFIKKTEHYGSTIFKVKATVLVGKDQVKEELNIVAKMLPPTDMQRWIFEAPFTFKKEVFFYEDLIPKYQKLFENTSTEKMKKFDVVPKFYGSRLSLDPEREEVDDDAVILMDNLKLKGYQMIDRKEGMDLAHAKLALKSLAKFHGAGLSIKQKDPIYEKKLGKYIKPLVAKGSNLIEQLSSELFTKLKNEKVLNDNDLDKLKKAFEPSERKRFNAEVTPDLPWTCLTHGDLWTNNMLFRDNELGQPEDVKFVDFQTYCNNSILRDLLFFLGTSIQLKLVESSFDDLLEFYRLELNEVLKELNCDADFVDCKETFYKRVKIDAHSELNHIFFMLKIITLDEGEVLENSELKQLHFDKYKEVVLTWQRHDWL